MIYKFYDLFFKHHEKYYNVEETYVHGTLIPDTFHEFQYIPYDLLIIFGLLISIIGLAGSIYHKRNYLIMLMCLELIMLSVGFLFIISSFLWHDSAGQIIALMLLAVAASEAAVGLSLVILYYRSAKTIDMYDVNRLRG